MFKVCCAKAHEISIYIYVELSFLLKVFRAQVRKNCILSLVLTTRRFFWIFRVQDRDYTFLARKLKQKNRNASDKPSPSEVSYPSPVASQCQGIFDLSVRAPHLMADMVSTVKKVNRATVPFNLSWEKWIQGNPRPCLDGFLWTPLRLCCQFPWKTPPRIAVHTAAICCP